MIIQIEYIKFTKQNLLIEHKFSKDDCLKFLLEHKKEIGINQITKYKLIIDKIK